MLIDIRLEKENSSRSWETQFRDSNESVLEFKTRGGKGDGRNAIQKARQIRGGVGRELFLPDRAYVLGEGVKNFSNSKTGGYIRLATDGGGEG